MDDLIETMPGANTAPPVLLLPGTGGTNREILDFGRRLAPTSPLMTIAGRQGSGAQRQYYTQTASSPANPAQIKAAAQWVADQAQRLCQEHHWDSSQLITVGYSNGAALGAYGVQMGLFPGRSPLTVAGPHSPGSTGPRSLVIRGAARPISKCGDRSKISGSL